MTTYQVSKQRGWFATSEFLVIREGSKHLLVQNSYFGQSPTGQSGEAETKSPVEDIKNIKPGKMLLAIFAEVGDTIVQLSTTYLGRSSKSKRGCSARNKVLLHIENEWNLVTFYSIKTCPKQEKSPHKTRKPYALVTPSASVLLISVLKSNSLFLQSFKDAREVQMFHFLFAEAAEKALSLGGFPTSLLPTVVSDYSAWAGFD